MADDDKLLSSNYDGIQEYDNDLPRWWLYLFYITIIFAPLYFWYFHSGPGLSPHENLAVQMKELEALRAQAGGSAQQDTESSLMALVGDSSVLAKGAGIFAGKCAACHSAQGQGLIGPNLTDNFFIHGSTILDSKKVVENGVLDKGMLAWKGLLNPEELNAVVAYVYSLRGSNPPNPKAAQGEPGK